MISATSRSTRGPGVKRTGSAGSSVISLPCFLQQGRQPFSLCKNQRQKVFLTDLKPGFLLEINMTAVFNNTLTVCYDSDPQRNLSYERDLLWKSLGTQEMSCQTRPSVHSRILSSKVNTAVQEHARKHYF